ncbi:MAG: hypothetical protein ACXW2I_10015 [Burkholderiales bacterium]
MSKRFVIAWVAVFIVWMAGSFIVHHLLLHADYSSVQKLFRAPEEAQQFFPFMIFAHVLMSGALVWIYSRGVESRAWLAQGIRFGIAVALLTVVPWYMIYYVVQPMPGALVVKQIVFDAILVVLLGIVTAFVYRDSPDA